jgi:hypothetical protein
MSCVAMALNGYGVTVPGNAGAATTPGSLNKWLHESNYYYCAGGVRVLPACLPCKQTSESQIKHKFLL